MVSLAEAVLAAVNALGANQYQCAERLTAAEQRLISMDAKLDDTNTRLRPIEDSLVDMQDLLVRALDR